MATFHTQALKDALEALFNLAAAPTGTPKLKYMSTSYTPDPDDAYWSDISADEAAGAPTVTLTNVAINIDATNNRVAIDFDNPSSNTITTTTNQFVVIIDTGNNATSPIVFSGSINTTLSPIAGTLSLTINANGIAALNAAVA